jgi:hypothetical protein
MTESRTCLVSEQRQINPWLIAVSVMFATFMEVLDTTVVNVSLPHIAGACRRRSTRRPGLSPRTWLPTRSSCR